jgi:integrase
MKTTQAKRGRKPRPYVCPWNNETIDGLRRRPSDGRWETADGRTFVEPDERLAVARYLKMTKRGPEMAVVLPVHDEQRPQLSDDQPQQAAHVLFEDSEDGYCEIGVPLAVVCAWIRDQLVTRPQWLAQHVGIEQLGYLSDVKAPEVLPTFAALEQAWKDHSSAGAEQRRKVLHAWSDFVATAKVQGLSDITPQAVIAFRDVVYARKLSGKSQANLYSRIRRLISFAKSRAMAVDACAKALVSLELLTPSDSTVALDPKPIEAADYQAMLRSAEGDDKAMLLLMLNCAMYLQEVCNLRWSDLKDNGCLVTHRKKTGKCVRVAVLWPETLQALMKMERRGEWIFRSYTGAQLGIKGAEKRFRALRDAAGVPHVTSSMLRDGAYTAAVDANVTADLCKLLTGHRCGISDHYVMRKPSMVAPACDAIRAAYFGKQQQRPQSAAGASAA